MKQWNSFIHLINQLEKFFIKEKNSNVIDKENSCQKLNM